MLSKLAMVQAQATFALSKFLTNANDDQIRYAIDQECIAALIGPVIGKSVASRLHVLESIHVILKLGDREADRRREVSSEMRKRKSDGRDEDEEGAKVVRRKVVADDVGVRSRRGTARRGETHDAKEEDEEEDDDEDDACGNRYVRLVKEAGFLSIGKRIQSNDAKAKMQLILTKYFS